MLVLSRRIGQEIRIGNDVRVIVLEVRGKNVRLGFVAPADVAIHRDETYCKIQAKKAPNETAPTEMLRAH